MIAEQLAPILYEGFREPYFRNVAVTIFAQCKLLWEDLTEEERNCWILMATYLLERFEEE